MTCVLLSLMFISCFLWKDTLAGCTAWEESDLNINHPKDMPGYAKLLHAMGTPALAEKFGTNSRGLCQVSVEIFWKNIANPNHLYSFHREQLHKLTLSLQIKFRLWDPQKFWLQKTISFKNPLTPWSHRLHHPDCRDCVTSTLTDWPLGALENHGTQRIRQRVRWI